MSVLFPSLRGYQGTWCATTSSRGPLSGRSSSRRPWPTRPSPALRRSSGCMPRHPPWSSTPCSARPGTSWSADVGHRRPLRGHHRDVRRPEWRQLRRPHGGARDRHRGGRADRRGAAAGLPGGLHLGTGPQGVRRRSCADDHHGPAAQAVRRRRRLRQLLREALGTRHLSRRDPLADLRRRVRVPGTRPRSAALPATWCRVSLVAVALGVIVVMLFHLDQKGVEVVGTITPGLPHLGLPGGVGLDQYLSLAGPAVGVVLVGFAEGIGAAKTTSARSATCWAAPATTSTPRRCTPACRPRSMRSGRLRPAPRDRPSHRIRVKRGPRPLLSLGARPRPAHTGHPDRPSPCGEPRLTARRFGTSRVGCALRAGDEPARTLSHRAGHDADGEASSTVALTRPVATGPWNQVVRSATSAALRGTAGDAQLDSRGRELAVQVDQGLDDRHRHLLDHREVEHHDPEAGDVVGDVEDAFLGKEDVRGVERPQHRDDSHVVVLCGEGHAGRGRSRMFRTSSSVKTTRGSPSRHLAGVKG